MCSEEATLSFSSGGYSDLSVRTVCSKVEIHDSVLIAQCKISETAGRAIYERKEYSQTFRYIEYSS